MAESSGKAIKKKGRPRTNSSRRDRAFRVCQEISVGCDFDLGTTGKDNRSGDFSEPVSSDGVLGCRSDRNASDMSSGLLSPRWVRLLRAVAHGLGRKFKESFGDANDSTVQFLKVFMDGNATGGGTQMDIHQLFKDSMEAMKLSDKSAGFVLIGAYHYLQAEDLHLTSQTWRSLVVTSLLVAVHTLCDNMEREQAKVKLMGSVAHWWSKPKADHAFDTFMHRDIIQREPLDKTKLAAYYFDLRARALEMSFESDSNPSAVFSVKLEPTDKQPEKWQNREAPHHPAHHAANSHDRAARSGASLALSDSRDTHNDGYASDSSVISI